MSLLINALSGLEKKNVLWGASYFPSNVIEAVVIPCQNNGMIHSGEKRAHQMPCLETHGWVLKFCICELLCWHHMDIMDILCAWSLPAMTLWESIILRARDSNALPLPDFAHEVWPRCCLSQTQLPLVTRYHREFNEPLAMCGLFIDGGHRKWVSPSEVTTTLD